MQVSNFYPQIHINLSLAYLRQAGFIVPHLLLDNADGVHNVLTGAVMLRL